MDSTALALTLAAFGLLLIGISYQRHRHQRDIAALAHGVGGAILFLCGVLLFALALNFNTYDKLQPEQTLAELSVEQSAPQTFQVRLMRIPAGDLQVFTLKGDRWQLKAQLLEWQSWMRWLGLSNDIRLEQLTSSFDAPTKPSKEMQKIGNSYRISRNPGISLWDLPEKYPERAAPVLHTLALQTESFELQPGVRFHIYLSNGVLTARSITQQKPAKSIVSPTADFKGVPRGAAADITDNTDESQPDEAPVDTSVAP